LENFTIGDKCRLLPICKLSFHAQCVDQWLLKHAICPICRSMVGSHSANKVIIGNNGRESIESGSSRNVVIELRENIPRLEVESQDHKIELCICWERSCPLTGTLHPLEIINKFNVSIFMLIFLKCH